MIIVTTEEKESNPYTNPELPTPSSREILMQIILLQENGFHYSHFSMISQVENLESKLLYTMYL